MNKLYKLITICTLALLACTTQVHAQGSPDYTGGLKVKLNDDGSKYFRLITWHQVWATSNLSDEEPSLDFLLRRSRFLMFAQINKRFLILTHFGLNSLSPANMGTASPAPGLGGNGRFFMHDAWVEYTVLPKTLAIGGGLHYWNGISRMTNQSTLNIMTLDAPIHNWANIGTSDQFARHLGFYAKGKIGKLDYRVSFNEALQSPTRGLSVDAITTKDDTGGVTGYLTDLAAYRNPTNPGGGKVVAGYVKYEFLDSEGNLLPYLVGSYLGGKKVFNVGAGFYYHQDGAVHSVNGTDLATLSPTSFGVDVFYDSPIGDNGAAFTGYASFVNHAWGANWTGGVGEVGTGSIIFAQAGFVIPGDPKGKARWQPYVHFTNRSLEAHQDFTDAASSSLGIGVNAYLSGHNAKITGEFQVNNGVGETEAATSTSLARIQLMIYL